VEATATANLPLNEGWLDEYIFANPPSQLADCLHLPDFQFESLALNQRLSGGAKIFQLRQDFANFCVNAFEADERFTLGALGALSHFSSN